MFRRVVGVPRLWHGLHSMSVITILTRGLLRLLIWIQCAFFTMATSRVTRRASATLTSYHGESWNWIRRLSQWALIGASLWYFPYATLRKKLWFRIPLIPFNFKISSDYLPLFYLSQKLCCMLRIEQSFIRAIAGLGQDFRIRRPGRSTLIDDASSASELLEAPMWTPCAPRWYVKI